MSTYTTKKCPNCGSIHISLYKEWKCADCGHTWGGKPAVDKCVDCGNEDVAPGNSAVCGCGEIVCEDCAYEIDDRVYCKACASRFFPQRRIEVRNVLYTAVLDCGHVVALTEKQYRKGQLAPCYKCYEAEKKAC